MQSINEYLLGKNKTKTIFKDILNADMTYDEVKEAFKKLGWEIVITDNKFKFKIWNIEEKMVLCLEPKTFQDKMIQIAPIYEKLEFCFKFDNHKIAEIEEYEFNKDKDKWHLIENYFKNDKEHDIEKAIDKINRLLYDTNK